jgi:cation transport protein ChaC
MDVWIFGYGSLIWKPGFDWAEQRLATLTGWRRRFCMTSIH